MDTSSKDVLTGFEMLPCSIDTVVDEWQFPFDAKDVGAADAGTEPGRTVTGTWITAVVFAPCVHIVDDGVIADGHIPGALIRRLADCRIGQVRSRLTFTDPWERRCDDRRRNGRSSSRSRWGCNNRHTSSDDRG